MSFLRTIQKFWIALPDAIQILLMGLCLVLVYVAGVRLTHLKAVLAETNVQSNLIRISNCLHGTMPETVLLGSSLSGRLLPEYFSTEGVEVANLGLDGSRPLFGEQVILRRAEHPHCVLVEANTLFMPKNANEDSLLEAIKNPVFSLGEKIAAFNPENRPSSVMYSLFKHRRDLSPNLEESAKKRPLLPSEINERLSKLRQEGVVVIQEAVSDSASGKLALPQNFTNLESNARINFLETDDGTLAQHFEYPPFRLAGTHSEINPTNAPPRSFTLLFKGRRDLSASGGEPSGEEIYAHLRLLEENEAERQLKELQNLGAQIVLLVVPTGKGESIQEEAKRVAQELHVPCIELRRLLPDGGEQLRFSDGYHLLGPSAREVVHCLVKELRKQGLFAEHSEAFAPIKQTKP